MGLFYNTTKSKIKTGPPDVVMRHPSVNPDPEHFFEPGNAAGLRELFLFAMSEVSGEDCVALSAIEDYRKSPDKDKMGFIYSTFIMNSAAYEVNLPGTAGKEISILIKEFYSARQHNKEESFATPQPNLFYEAQAAINTNLADTITRFLNQRRSGAEKKSFGKTIITPYRMGEPISASKEKSKYRELFSAMKQMGFKVHAGLSQGVL
jgi:hypothetical protein